jgi:hypothetical protein
MSALPLGFIDRAVSLSLFRSETATDPRFAIHELLASVTSTLISAESFRDDCKRLHDQAVRRRRTWGEPEVFFFDSSWQADVEATRNADESYLSKYALTVAERSPESAKAWRSLDAIIRGALPSLIESVEARRVARAMPQLKKSARSLAKDHEAANGLADLLDVADDMIIRVVHPESRLSFRIQATGIESNHQLQTLLTDLLFHEMDLSDHRPNADAVRIYKGQLIAEGLTVRAGFGMYRRSALKSDGSLINGLAGCDHFIWPEGAPDDIPVFDGEREIILGRLPYVMSWDVERRFATMRSEIEIISRMTDGADSIDSRRN